MSATAPDCKPVWMFFVNKNSQANLMNEREWESEGKLHIPHLYPCLSLSLSPKVCAYWPEAAARTTLAEKAISNAIQSQIFAICKVKPVNVVSLNERKKNNIIFKWFDVCMVFEWVCFSFEWNEPLPSLSHICASRLKKWPC